MDQQGAKVVWLTSPNNPTGNLVGDEELRAILDLDALIVLDEAYIEVHPPHGFHNTVWPSCRALQMLVGFSCRALQGCRVSSRVLYTLAGFHPGFYKACTISCRV